MVKLNKKLEYALISLKYMSDKPEGELTTAKEICAETRCPFDAISRVLQQMASNGLLKSEQGAHGGYFIHKNLGTVSFFVLMEMILGPLGIVKCVHSSDCELIDNCNIQFPLFQLNEKLKSFYEALTLRELLLVNPVESVSSQRIEARSVK